MGEDACGEEEMRSFISMDITSKDVLDKIKNFQTNLKNTACPMKVVERENLHLTLKFLGEISESSYKRIVESLDSSLSEYSSFEVNLKGTGFFPSISDLRVIWIGMNAPEIIYIQKEIDDTLCSMGFKEDRKFVPHLTVSRVKSSLNKKPLLNVLDEYKDYDFGTDRITKINFKKSTLTPQGPIYETLKEFKLKSV
ncbi:MAG: 2',5' RNA ligase family [Candidatus Methanofastidiosum methylothiophilum]|uniref:RNA 2',3'-cyclic phosphodiesterase n=1 Tax=Candidatus Methanofastidiosum methylothiophilum TaxID=1705564 RepID=A0A150IWP8_9EURY|nr:MAG: 2',5' RNA ligase family [Candidatus Methanofastidiosum methylthiophilus]